MRSRGVLAVAAAAVLLGGATGAVLHGGSGDGNAIDTAGRPPARVSRLLATADLSRLGAPTPLSASSGSGEGEVARTVCPSWHTLADQLPAGVPMSHRSWTSGGETIVAEVSVRLGSAQQGARLGESILDGIESCRDHAKGPLSYAATSVAKPTRRDTIFWMTLRRGRAFGARHGPDCGGVVMAISGPGLAILGVPWCTDAAHMKRIARAAVQALR